MPRGALRRRLYALGFVDEFGPIYALYTVLFLDNGITAAQVSMVFVVWALVEMVCEIPSGALADRVDRRRLLGVAFALRAIGIAVWLVVPSYPGVLLGAALWALHSSLASGAREALIHDELAAAGEAAAYPVVMARIGQLGHVGVALGTIVASVAVTGGATIEQLGWVTVAIHVVSIRLVLSLPDVRRTLGIGERGSGLDAGDLDVGGSGLRAWWATLRTGLARARRSPVAKRLIVLGASLEGLLVIDEYVPILAVHRGADEAVVPLFVLSVFVGVVAGGELAACRPRLPGRTLGRAVIGGAILTGVAVAVTPAWPLVLIGAGYVALETLWIIGDARLQERIEASTRATVTSVRSFLSNLVGIAAFGVVALLASGGDPSPGLLGVALGLAIVGVLAIRWVPASRAGDRTDA